MTRVDRQKKEQLKTIERQRIANDELQSIIRVISHDLRTPLVSAHGFSDLLTKYCQALSRLINKPELKKYFDKRTCEIIKHDIPQSANYISKSLEEMDGLIEGLTNISRAGAVEVNIEKIEMNKLVSGVADAIKFQIDSAHALLIVDHLPDCKADKHLLNEVFVNLIANAVKFLDTERKGMINITGKVEAAKAIYCVRDNGIGIKPKNHSKVFQLFFREKPCGNFNGEGIGLSFVQRAIDRLRGDVWVESEPGRGSSFFIALPAAKPVNMPKNKLIRAYKAISAKNETAIPSAGDVLGLNPL